MTPSPLRVGRFLRWAAACLCSPTTLERLIDPIIADLQHEYGDAVRNNRLWLGSWIVLSGYVAFSKAAVLFGLERATHPAKATDDERRQLIQALVLSLGTTMVITALMAWVPWHTVKSSGFLSRQGGSTMALRAVVMTIPQALPLAIPVGLTFGILIGCGGHAMTRLCRRRLLALAAACALVSFIILCWIMPAANQAFRVSVFQDGLGRTGYPMRGAAEMTLGELRQRITSLETDGFERHGSSSWERNYYTRWALAFAALALAGFGVAVLSRWRLGRTVAGGVAVVACLVYYLLLYAGSDGVWRQHLPAYVAAWLPNVVFVGLSLCVFASLRRDGIWWISCFSRRGF